MKNSGLLKKVICVCVALVLINGMLLELSVTAVTTTGVSSQKQPDTVVQTTNNQSVTTGAPCIVAVNYPAQDVVVADIIATQAPYFADRTGATDCTRVLQ